jgi:hypothetical protein
MGRERRKVLDVVLKESNTKSQQVEENSDNGQPGDEPYIPSITLQLFFTFLFSFSYCIFCVVQENKNLR